MKKYQRLLHLLALFVFFIGINHEFILHSDSHAEDDCPVCQIIHSGITEPIAGLTEYQLDQGDPEIVILHESCFYGFPQFKLSPNRAPPPVV